MSGLRKHRHRLGILLALVLLLTMLGGSLVNAAGEVDKQAGGAEPLLLPIIKALDDTATTQTGEAVTIDVLANDYVLQIFVHYTKSVIEITKSPANGTAQIVNNKIVYTPGSTFVGTDSFEYKMKAAWGIFSGTDKATVKITVTSPPNQPPQASDISQATTKNEPLTIDLLAACSDPDGDTLTIISITDPSNGSATLAADIATYEPTTDFVGEDQFTYTVSDGALTATANVIITINEPDIPEPTTGSLTVMKQLQGGGSADAQFKIEILPVATEAQHLAEAEPIYISVNQPWTGELEPGQYQIVESDLPEDYFFEEISQEIVNIVAGCQHSVTIVNRYEEPLPEPETGTLIIRKQITGSGHNRNARFLVTIEPQLLRNQTATQSVYISVNEPWSGELEPGMYLIREVELPSSRYSLVDIEHEGIVEVIANETAEITVTNRYRPPAPIVDPEPSPEPQPQEPAEPAEPEIPVEPEQPEEPEAPEEPVTPESPAKPEPPPTPPTDPGALPQTSSFDNSLLLGAILTAAGFWMSRKR